MYFVNNIQCSSYNNKKRVITNVHKVGKDKSSSKSQTNNVRESQKHTNYTELKLESQFIIRLIHILRWITVNKRKSTDITTQRLYKTKTLLQTRVGLIRRKRKPRYIKKRKTLTTIYRYPQTVT